MTDDNAGRVQTLLDRLGDGERAALDELLSLVYEELRLLARSQRRKHARPSRTLDTTALVHEVYLKLGSGNARPPENREHLFAIAATAMRQLLVDEARRHLAQKRGGGERPITLEEGRLRLHDAEQQAAQFLELDRALNQLEQSNSRLRQVVECRFFAGLTEIETARALGVGERTVRRDWFKAKAWLQHHLSQ